MIECHRVFRANFTRDQNREAKWKIPLQSSTSLFIPFPVLLPSLLRHSRLFISVFSCLHSFIDSCTCVWKLGPNDTCGAQPLIALVMHFNIGLNVSADVRSLMLWPRSEVVSCKRFIFPSYSAVVLRVVLQGSIKVNKTVSHLLLLIFYTFPLMYHFLLCVGLH